MYHAMTLAKTNCTFAVVARVSPIPGEYSLLRRPICPQVREIVATCRCPSWDRCPHPDKGGSNGVLCWEWLGFTRASDPFCSLAVVGFRAAFLSGMEPRNG